MPILRDAAYPYPPPTLKFLGTVIQKYRPRGGRPASRFQSWIDELGTAVRDRLVPPLREVGLMLDADVYSAAGVADDCTLAQIADFNSLVSISQEHATPVFALTAEQLGTVGVVLEGAEGSRDNFHRDFSDLATRIEALTSPAP
jgi:hypothetical protein